MRTSPERRTAGWRQADLAVALIAGLLAWMCIAAVAAVVLLPVGGTLLALAVAAAAAPMIALLVLTLFELPSR